MGANFMNELTTTENKKSAVKRSRKASMLVEQGEKSSQSKEQSLVISDANNKAFFVDADENSTLTITENKNIKLSHIDPDILSFYCRGINESKINLDDCTAKEKFLRRLCSQDFYKYPQEMLTEIRQFIENWEKIKKQKTHDRMMAEPNKSKFVRSVENHQFTAIHFFTRNQIFQIIGKRERGKLVEINQFGDEIDLVCNRSFSGWGGDIHFNISGAILCTYDQEVFDACIKLWLEKCDGVGLTLKTNLSEIWRTLGNTSRLSSYNITSLKRSLQRLYQISITARSSEGKSFWGGGIVDDVVYLESMNTKNNQIIIGFNKYLVKHYLEGAYAILSHPVYQLLSAYSKKIYLFLMSHSDKLRKMGLEKWREPLGISFDVPLKELKRNINNAIKELINLNVLDSISCINNKNEVCTLICDAAWAAKPIFVPNSSNQISV